MAAKYMIEKLGKNAKIAELQGIPGASATRERGKGFDGAAKVNLTLCRSRQPVLIGPRV